MPFEKRRLATALRARAQARLDSQAPLDEAPKSMHEAQRLLHELQVHQIELEMQNEELQRSRAEVEAALSGYTELYDFAPVGYFTLDRSGCIVQANVVGARLLGSTSVDLVGQRLASYMDDADKAAFHALTVQVFAAVTAQAIEVDLAPRGQPRLAVQIVATLLPDEQACCISVTDINDRKLLEQARYRAVALDVERQAALASSQAKSAFMSRMSHELRTPLNAILGFAQLLQLDKCHVLDDVQRQRVKAVLSAGGHLLNLIEDVLDLSRIESGTVRIDMADVPLQAQLDEALMMVDPVLENSGLSMTFSQIPAVVGDELMVRADRARLVQVLVNLLSNAIKYNSPGGSVHVTVDTAQAGCIDITVADTGRGMSAAQMSSLFQPFNRLGLERSSIPGTGIGLLITKQLVEMMGGTLTVQSQAGLGSRFGVSLRACGATDLSG